MITQAERRLKRATVAKEFESIRADYEMSRESRFVRRRTGLAPQGGSADYHYRNETAYYNDIEKARDMDRNDSIIGQIIDRAVANEVQEGFTLDPQTGDEALDTDLYYRFQEWATDPELCDVGSEYTWHDFEKHTSRSAKLDGDCLVAGLDDGRLQFFEAHEIQTKTRRPNTFLGVTLDDHGRHEAYWIQQDPSTPDKQKQSEVSLAVRNSDGVRQLFHAYSPKRMSQTRGVTALAPIFSLSGMFEDIQFAKLVQQQVVSCFAIFREQSPIGGSGLPGTAAGYGSQVIETSASGTRYIENIAPGMEIVGAPGEKLQGFAPNVPNAEYFSHVKLMLQMIGVNLGLPLCLVLMDGSETNFSGWRGAVDEARKGFKFNQRNQVQRLHTPVYKWKLSQWVYEDAALRSAFARIGQRLFNHKWNAPRWSYIEPVTDAQGDQLRLQNGLTSPRRLHAERGSEWEEIADEIVADMAYAIRLAKATANKINAEIKDDNPVHWRELVNLPMPIGVTQSKSESVSDLSGQPTTKAETTSKPATTDDPATTEPTVKVANTAINGAQVTAASSIVEKIAQGLLPRESGVAQLMFFFQLTKEQAEEIVGTAGTSAFVVSPQEPSNGQ